MNIKQKRIAAMKLAYAEFYASWRGGQRIDAAEAHERALAAGLDAADAVLADPANWTKEMVAMMEEPVMQDLGGNLFIVTSKYNRSKFLAIINHVRCGVDEGKGLDDEATDHA